MSEVIRKLEKKLNVTPSNMDNLFKTDTTWYNTEYKPPKKFTSPNLRINKPVVSKEVAEKSVEAVEKSIEVVKPTKKSSDNVVNQVFVDISTLGPYVNFLQAIAKNSKNTRAKVEARQTLEFLKANTQNSKVHGYVFEQIEKSVKYLRDYLNIG